LKSVTVTRLDYKQEAFVMVETDQFFLAQPREELAAAIARIESVSQKRFSQTGSGRMLWHVWGKGRPLVLLHGGFGSWLHWIRNIAEWRDRFTVFAATMPGFGDSDDFPKPHTVENLAAAVSTGIDQILPPGEQFHLLGFSFGGTVGGFVAALQGDRVLSLTFSGSGAMGLTRNPIEPLRNWRNAQTQTERLDAHRRNLEILMVADPQKVDALAVYIQDWNTQRCRVRAPRNRHQDILRAPLSQLKGRLLGLYGNRDARFKGHLPEQAAYLRAIQPDAIFRDIDGAGHWACYEAADTFNKTYLEMLNGIHLR
jgi:pimeloyl-ACP methyl ester carboxylesterase